MAVETNQAVVLQPAPLSLSSDKPMPPVTRGWVLLWFSPLPLAAASFLDDVGAAAESAADGAGQFADEAAADAADAGGSAAGAVASWTSSAAADAWDSTSAATREAMEDAGERVEAAKVGDRGLPFRGTGTSKGHVPHTGGLCEVPFHKVFTF